MLTSATSEETTVGTTSASTLQTPTVLYVSATTHSSPATVATNSTTLTSATSEETTVDITSTTTRHSSTELNVSAATHSSPSTVATNSTTLMSVTAEETTVDMTSASTLQTSAELNVSTASQSNPTTDQTTDRQTSQPTTLSQMSTRDHTLREALQTRTPALSPNKTSVLCPCRGQSKASLQALAARLRQSTQDAIAEESIHNIKQELTVERSSVSSTRRSKLSQGDENIAYGVAAFLAALAIAQLVHSGYSVHKHGLTSGAQKPGEQKQRNKKRRGGDQESSEGTRQCWV